MEQHCYLYHANYACAEETSEVSLMIASDSLVYKIFNSCLILVELRSLGIHFVTIWMWFCRKNGHHSIRVPTVPGFAHACFVLQMTIDSRFYYLWYDSLQWPPWDLKCYHHEREWYKQTFRKFQPWPSQVSMEHYCVVCLDCAQYCVRSAAAQNFRSGTHDMLTIQTLTNSWYFPV